MAIRLRFLDQRIQWRNPGHRQVGTGMFWWDYLAIIANSDDSQSILPNNGCMTATEQKNRLDPSDLGRPED